MKKIIFCFFIIMSGCKNDITNTTYFSELCEQAGKESKTGPQTYNQLHVAFTFLKRISGTTPNALPTRLKNESDNC